ncbi:TPA: glycosyltransferase family 4 protein [Klebsiella variicola subsp. variicola]|uniref:glycosyltransferase family 4 protein n=1 Tax=Klebsiella variicola TaxID=244366 RepID=UPI0027E70F8C|nr:glycosyltransferase family 4 protein [Klebsiella variicola]
MEIERYINPMKILIFNTLYFPYRVGGAELSVQILAESLAVNGHEVTIMTLHEKDEVEKEYENKVEIIRLPLLNRYWVTSTQQSSIKKILWHVQDIYNCRMKKAVSQALINKKFDLVHTNNLCGFSVAVWDWAKSNDIPIVHTARDYYLMNPNSKLYRRGRNHSSKTLDSWLFSFYKKIKSHKVNAFVGISSYIKERHVKNGYFKRASKHVIYNAIKSPVLLEEKSIYSFYRDEIILGFLGRIESSKGIELLLDAMHKYNDQNIFIKIAGKGESEYIDYLKKKYSNVHMEFVGTVKIEKFLPQLNFLIVPSQWNEPFGRVVIEANSYGIPVIASNKGGIPEIVVPNVTGYVFETENHLSLIDSIKKIKSMSANEYHEMKKSALIFSRGFDTRQITNLYLEVYQTAVNKYK